MPIWDVVRTLDTVVVTPVPAVVVTLFTVDATLTDVAVTEIPVPWVILTDPIPGAAVTGVTPKPKPV